MTKIIRFLERTTTEGKYIRQTSGGGDSYGHILMLIEPSEEPGLTFAWEVSDSQIPSTYADAVYAGINKLFQKDGVFADHRCENTLVRVIDGSHHSVDSNNYSYKTAAKIAFQKAVNQSGSISESIPQ
jgi:elongation factor G